MTNFRVAISDEQDKVPVNTDELQDICTRMLEYLFKQVDIINLSVLKDHEIKDLSINFDVLICDDRRIQEINKEFRKQDKPTDVITFALFADNQDFIVIAGKNIYLGEIIISAEKAQTQAKENNKSLKEEMSFLLSHGILHLLGFEHKDEESLKFMLDIQANMLKNS